MSARQRLEYRSIIKRLSDNVVFNRNPKTASVLKELRKSVKLYLSDKSELTTSGSTLILLSSTFRKQFQ